MEDFRFYAPTYFVFGKQSEESTGEMIRKFGGTKALLHYGGGSVVKNGILGRVKAVREGE